MGQNGHQRLLAPVDPLVEPQSLQSRRSRRNAEVSQKNQIDPIIRQV